MKKIIKVLATTAAGFSILAAPSVLAEEAKKNTLTPEQFLKTSQREEIKEETVQPSEADKEVTSQAKDKQETGVKNSVAEDEKNQIQSVTHTNSSSDEPVLAKEAATFPKELNHDRVVYTDSVGFEFSKELPAPTAKKNGRGEPIEHLISNYEDTYLNDPYLHDQVINFRRWEWKEMYESLDKKAQERPDYLDTYRLQAEVYLVNKNYKEALSQLDRILRKNPTDLQALALSALAAKTLESEEQVVARLQALKYVSPKAYEDVAKIFNYVDENSAYKINYGSYPLTDMTPEAIAVFGQTPNKDGSPSPALLTRLEKTKEMAERYPNVPIVLSGGPVQTPYSEATVMYKWLKENGVDEKRLILDEIARDTPGNAVGMVKAFKEYNAHKILAIGTILHVPRAKMVLQVYGNAVGYDMTIDTAGGGGKPSEAKKKIEHLYTYVNALRAAHLYTKDDFKKYPLASFDLSKLNEGKLPESNKENTVPSRPEKPAPDFPIPAKVGTPVNPPRENSDTTAVNEPALVPTTPATPGTATSAIPTAETPATPAVAPTVASINKDNTYQAPAAKAEDKKELPNTGGKDNVAVASLGFLGLLLGSLTFVKRKN